MIWTASDDRSFVGSMLIPGYGGVSTCQSCRACRQQLSETKAQVPEGMSVLSQSKYHVQEKGVLADQIRYFLAYFVL